MLNNTNSKNIPIIIGILLPLVFMLIISIIVFAKQASIRPSYNFLYTACDRGEYVESYKLEKGKLVIDTSENWRYSDKYNDDYYKQGPPPLFLHNISADVSQEISYDVVKNMNTMWWGSMSPDGYEIYRDDGRSYFLGIFTSARPESTYYVLKGNASKKITGVVGNEYCVYGTFEVLGWGK